MSKSRYPYSRADEMDMWLYLYEQLRRGVPAASEPKGLKIWRMYAQDRNCDRTADSLTSRFRKNMMNRLYDANLPCHKMMYLYLELQIPMDADVKAALELKFGIKIDLKSSGILKSFRRVERAKPEAHFDQVVTAHVPEPSTSRHVQQGELVPNNNEVERSLTASPTSENNDVELSSEGSSNSSLWATSSSVNFTRQIRQVEDESRLRARREAMIANNRGNEDGGDGECTSLQSIIIDSSDINNHLQSSKPSTNEVPTADYRVADQIGVSDENVQVESVQYDEHEQGPRPPQFLSEQQNKKTENSVVVSTTSDSCQKSLARLCNAYGLPELQCQLKWRHSKEVSMLSDRWKDKVEEIICSYELSCEDIDGMRSAILAEQTQLLTQSQTKEDYLNSLIELKNSIKKQLDDLVREYRTSESEQKPVVARNRESGYDFHMRHSYEQISLSVRKEELERVASQIPDSVQDAHVIATLKLVEVVEDLTAATSENTSDYIIRMAEVREAVRDRVSKILEGA